MSSQSPKVETQIQTAIAISLRLAFIAFLIYLSFKILAPFILPIVWGIIIAIGIYPIFKKFAKWFGGKEKIASTVIVLIGIGILVVPFGLMISGAVNNGQAFMDAMNDETFQVPPPPADVADWPLIGDQVYDLWAKSNKNIDVLIVKLRPFLSDFVPKILSSFAGVVGTVFQFILSIIIAGIFLVFAEPSKKAAQGMFIAIIGEEGENFVELARGTITSVVQGVLGIAVIQTIFLGMGMYFVGMPGAEIWTVIVLFVAIIQLPPTLVMIPVIIYIFGVESSTTAIIFTIWSIFWSLADSFLKPMLLGRGVEIPMLVILLGAIGGMVAFGIIGLFVGSVGLALTYKVILAIGQERIKQMKE